MFKFYIIIQIFIFQYNRTLKFILRFYATPSLFTITLPVLLGYIPLGITFGFLMVSQGIAWYIPILFSIFLYLRVRRNF